MKEKYEIQCLGFFFLGGRTCFPAKPESAFSSIFLMFATCISIYFSCICVGMKRRYQKKFQLFCVCNVWIFVCVCFREQQHEERNGEGESQPRHIVAAKRKIRLMESTAASAKRPSSPSASASSGRQSSKKKAGWKGRRSTDQCQSVQATNLLWKSN